jgi:hypothetical protein
MAKTRVLLDFSFSLDQLKDSISKADLTGKEALEAYYGFHARKAWRSEFEGTNGRLQSMQVERGRGPNATPANQMSWSPKSLEPL